jgi:hypothetical protein
VTRDGADVAELPLLLEHDLQGGGLPRLQQFRLLTVDLEVVLDLSLVGDLEDHRRSRGNRALGQDELELGRCDLDGDGLGGGRPGADRGNRERSQGAYGPDDEKCKRNAGSLQRKTSLERPKDSGLATVAVEKAVSVITR